MQTAGFLLSAAFVRMFLAAASPVSLSLEQPVDFQVVQRRHMVGGPVRFAGSLPSPAHFGDRLELEWSADDAPPHRFLLLTLAEGQNRFAVDAWLPAGGWYQARLHWVRDGAALGEALVSHLGVGEVFLVAGQSNAANHGEKRLEPQSDQVVAFDGSHWLRAADPQPGASGGGGSFLPPLGDLLRAKWNVPVGFIPAAEGATSVREWQPAGTVLPNPPTLTGRVVHRPDGAWVADGALFDRLVAREKSVGPQGFRMVLWHQGESDANQADPSRTLAGTNYSALLKSLIAQSRKASGWDAPWMVARATYHTPADTHSDDIRDAQRQVVEVGSILEGPDTDALAGPLRDGGGLGVHFSEAGLKAHAAAWADKIDEYFKNMVVPADNVPVSRPSLPLSNVRSILVAGRPGFVQRPRKPSKTPQPWVFYAPTLPGLPDINERYIADRLDDAGIAFAGLDVGEAYGNPTSREWFDAFLKELVKTHGFAARPCLLGRSRGGLAVASWGSSRPEMIAGLAGIYPVFDVRSYPGADKAASAYSLPSSALDTDGFAQNPINRMVTLARAGVPAFLIHGDSDTVVPIGPNSRAFVTRYESAGSTAAVRLIVLPGQGHNLFEGFFKAPEFAQFLIDRANAGADR
jgi:predicted esterase